MVSESYKSLKHLELSLHERRMVLVGKYTTCKWRIREQPWCFGDGQWVIGLVASLCKELLCSIAGYISTMLSGIYHRQASQLHQACGELLLCWVVCGIWWIYLEPLHSHWNVPAILSLWSLMLGGIFLFARVFPRTEWMWLLSSLMRITKTKQCLLCPAIMSIFFAI